MRSHPEDVVLELEDGWPARAVCRDGRGSVDRAAAHDDITAIMPLGVINALGVAGCIGERELLNDLRALLERLRARGGRYPTTLLDRLLDDGTWSCEASLLTRMKDLNELPGDAASQSVYVTIPNSLHEGSRS
jgi:siderophore synthetase component